MKVILSTDNIGRGGKERQLFMLAVYLITKGYIVKIITKNFSPNNYIGEYEIDKSNILVYQDYVRGNNYTSFKNIIEKEKPDIVFTWDIKTSLYALLLYKRKKFHFINASLRHGVRLYKPSHLWRSILMLLSPYVVANSHAGIKANNLKPGKRRFVIYNGVENKFNNTLSKYEIELKRNEYIPGYSKKKGMIFISVANLIPYKDYLTVLKALHRLKSVMKFYYLIIGDGPERNKIKDFIKEYGLSEKVIMLGKIPNVGKYLSISDIMIHSSRGEGISNAILEGMYAGLPVIASNVGGVPETVYPKSSLLFPFKDENKLFNCLFYAKDTFESFDPTSDDYLRHLNKFSVEAMVEKYEQLINQIVNDKNNN